MANLSVFTRIGNAFAVLFGKHGAVTEQAQKADCSRQTVYDHAVKVELAVQDAQLPGPSRADLLNELKQLKDEHRQLWHAFEHSFDCPENKRRQFVVTANAMGLSLQQSIVLLAILLPRSLVPSRATAGRWVLHAAKAAKKVLQTIDALCRTVVVSACLDEIFFHRQPVLMGIEPLSMTWIIGARATDRSGPSWCKVLAPWSAVTDVAADGGSGIELGLRLFQEKRQEEAQTKHQGQQQQAPQPSQPCQDQAKQLPPATKAETVPLRIRLDVFHTKREGNRALRIEWSQAESLWQEAEKLGKAKKRFDSKGINRKGFRKDKVEKAWRKAEAAFETVERKEKAWQRVCAALEIFRPDGQLNDRAWAEKEIAAAAEELSGQRWAKTKRMLQDNRALTFLDRMHEELAKAEECPLRREALVALWRWRHAKKTEGEAKSSVEQLKGVWQGLVMKHLGKNWEQGYRKVSKVLREVVRASSAVECVNSVVRMHQARHRNLSQELIDLKRLYWNCRSFVGGKRKGRCPYQHLRIKLPTYDAWELLQMNPEELKQKLSSSRVAA